MANRKRREDETFEEYRKNLKNEEMILKYHLKGKIIWNSKEKGQYRGIL